MNIRIKTIPHKKQEYITHGNWYYDKKGNLTITVSDFGNWKYEFLVAIHEMVEVALCKDRDISDKEVTNFDLKHLDAEEPGFLKDSIYYKEHQVADVVERLMANQLNINWEEYENTEPL